MMQRVIRASDLPGLPVVTIFGGEDIAEIKDVIFDGSEHRLIGFTLNKRGWFRGKLKAQLPAGSIEAIGTAAVMVASDEELEESRDSSPALAGDIETHSVLHNRVLSADGADLGEIVGVIISTGDDPVAVGYEVNDESSTVFVPISAQMALSDQNLIVPSEAAEFIRNDLVGFGAAVGEYRRHLEGGKR